MDTNKEKLQIEVAFSRLSEDMLKLLSNHVSKTWGIGMRLLFAYYYYYYYYYYYVVVVVVLYLTFIKIHVSDKTYYKRHSLQPGLFTPK